jgi:hypothetical protein
MAVDIDPVKYGVLWQKVQDYERRFDEMEKKIDKMELQLEKLVALANQGRGGLWMGMGSCLLFPQCSVTLVIIGQNE